MNFAVRNARTHSSFFDYSLRPPGVTGLGKDRICDMKTLGLAMHAARDGTGEVQHLLSSTTFNPRLPGSGFLDCLTKMVSRLGKEGAWRKAMEIYQSLPQTGVCPDTAITNAAISACDKGGQWRAALGIYESMDAQGLRQDAITCSSLISALAKGKQWALALQVFDDMQARGVLADVVTCCSLINALERGGQWQLAEQLFVQMCAASWQSQGVNSPLYRIMEIAAAPAVEVTEMALSNASSGPPQAVAWDAGNMGLRTDRATSTDDAGKPQHEASRMSAAFTASGLSHTFKTIEPMSNSAQQVSSSPFEVQRSMTFSQHSMRSPNEMSKGMLSNAFARSDKQTHPLGQAPSDLPSPTTDDSKGSLVSDDPKLEVSRGSTMMQSPSALHLSRSFRSAGSSNSISYSPSDYTPKHAKQSSCLELTGSGVGLHSPARPPYAAYFQALTGQTSSSPDLLQSFSSMHVGDTAPPVQRALFPQEQPGQSSAVRTSCSTSHERSDSTTRRIQEAAVNRQEMLSLRPTTNPVGGSMGPAPVLRHMNVSQIAPNRVCCNALLAAYARAKPTLWQKALAFLEVMQSSTGHIQPDTVTYNTVLKACCNAGQLNRAMQVFQTMVGSGVELTITTFGTLLIAGADAHDYNLVQEVWACLEQAGLEANPACINAYVQALVHQGEWSEAQKHFKHLLGRGSRVRAPIVTINTIMAAYMKQGMFEQVQQVFDDMYTAGLQPNIMTYVTLLSSYAELGNWQGAMQVLNHMCRTQVAIVPNTLSFNHVLAALHKAATQSCTPDMRVTLAESGVNVFNLMLSRERTPPDTSTYDTLMALMTHVGAAGQALHVHQLKLQQGLSANGAGLMRIISCCSQLGQWDKAYAAWTGLQAAGMQPDGACLNALLAALQAAKQWHHVVQVFQAARQTQVHPDSAAYNTVLAALLDAEQLQGSVCIVNDMRLQHLPVETASCDRMVLMLMMTGELELACKLTQDLLQHGQAVGSEALARMVHLLKDDGQVWKAFHLIKTAHQVAPTVKLDINEYTHLAEKALNLFGMAPAVWLLAQLHEIDALRLYSLPSKLNISHVLANETSSAPTESPKAVTEALLGIGSNSFDCNHSEALNGRGASKQKIERPYSVGAGALDAAHIVKLIGLSVDIAIVVVLSWAAQLAQLEKACVVIKAESVTFILGKYRVKDSSFDPTALRLALTKLLKLEPERDGESKSWPILDKNTLPADLDSTCEDRNDMTLAASHLYLWLDKHREALKKLLSGSQAAPLSPVLSNDQNSSKLE
ncbi:TPA: hypothetical protein ACH3X1_005611 [Trebouxia sp. C0004]